jgi:hypothetical protein
VLIDADDASAKVASELLEEVAKHGAATVKRAYGAWTSSNLSGWKEHPDCHGAVLEMAEPPTANVEAMGRC